MPNRASVYGKNKSGIPIYGIGDAAANACNCIVDPSYVVGLQRFSTLLGILRTTIGQFYPPNLVNAPFSADFVARGTVDPAVIVRLKWIRAHKPTQFDTSKQLHIDWLKDIYLSINCDWRKDPLFK